MLQLFTEASFEVGTKRENVSLGYIASLVCLALAKVHFQADQ